MLPWRKRTPDGSPNSVFGEILDWLLAPLLFLWPFSIIVTHQVADRIANRSFDHALGEQVQMLARFVTIDGDRVQLNLPAPGRILFRSSASDVVFFQVRTDEGFVGGDAEIPAPPRPWLPDGEVRWRDDVVAGEPVRVAARIDRRPGPEQPRFVIAQVAETLNKRRELASDVVTGVLLPQFALIPLSVVLVWFGLTRGIAPLARLQARIRQRRPTDLSPIAPESVPEEVRPLIVAFNDMMARLEENLQAQRRFIADAAHQMRTPITGLKMQAELALRERDPQALRQDLQRLHGAAERAAHLIQQLLTLARAESSSETVHRIERLDVQELLRDVALELYPKAQHKALELGFDESEGRLEVEGNRLMLQELFKNLVDNAIQYTPPGGSVTLRALARGDSIDVEIEDTGIGIPPADRPRVFERFYRVLDTGVDGSGLGLAIVREIAEMHRADVSLEPNPHGQGTLARVRFPLPARSPARQDERPRAKDD